MAPDLPNEFHLHREDVLATSQSPLLTDNQILHVHSDGNSELLASDQRDTLMNIYDSTHAPAPCPRKKHPLVRNATRRFRYTSDAQTGGNVQHNRLLPGHRLRIATHAIRAIARFQQPLLNNINHHTYHGDVPRQCSSGAPYSGIEISTFGYGAVSALSSRNCTHASSIRSLGGHSLDEPHEICRVETESKTQSWSPLSSPIHTAPAILVDQLASLLQNRSQTELSALGGVQGVANLLQSRIDTGIDDDPDLIRELKHKYGSNTYIRRPPKGFFSFLFDACRDPTLIILIVCALLSLGFGIKSHGIAEGWYDGASILFAVMLVVLVTSISDYRQSLQFLVLNEEKRNIQVHVIRGGRRMRVSIFDLVVGDIVSLSIGDQVPADGLFVDGHSLELDESTMTGESEPVHISDTMPFLMSGCKVEDGYGTMLVTSVGMRTEWGKLMAQLEEDMGEETPLQVRLNAIATFVGQIGLSVALIVFVILFVFYFMGHKAGSNGSGYFKAHKTSITSALNSVVDIFAIAVTIVVVAVPEGLPLAVTLSLAYAMKKMMVDRALVRRLSACETMGSATTICTDKTGTLTLNLMTVVKVCIAENVWNAEHVGAMIGFDNLLYGLLLEGISHNSAASVFMGDGSKEPEVSGSATEKAVLVWGLKLGMDFYKERSGSTILQVETFNSVKKRAGVALKSVASHDVHVHWKGAAEILLDESDKMLDSDGSTVIITSERRQKLLRVIEAMASESLRCIAFGYMELDPDEVPSGEQLEVWKIPEGPLTLLAIIGMKDPCRPGVPEAVHKCQQAGIMVRMITGDNLATAKAIATECGIFKQEYQAVDGPTFRSYTDSEREARVPNICVMARSSPSDKLLMVLTLKRMGEVVAVTGDGTNDSPALHAADVGLAMGIQGTEVAKESSDIIILDDNFATVVKVVRWGRSIYVNIQKFIQFQLTVNVAALTINFVAAIVTGDVPLTAVQLLWVNLIMDTLGALALATEPPTDELLETSPGRPTDPLVTNVMIRNLLLQAIYQVTVLLTLQFRGKELLRLKGNDASDVNNTVIFNAFVLCQVFNEVNARNPEKVNIFKGLLKNRLFVGIIVGTVVLQVVIVEFLNKFASTVKLSWELWLVSIGIGFVSWPLAFLGKFIPLPQKPLLLGLHRFKPCCGEDET